MRGPFLLTTYGGLSGRAGDAARIISKMWEGFCFSSTKAPAPLMRYRANTGSPPARLAVFRQEGRKIQIGFFQFSGRGARLLGGGGYPLFERLPKYAGSGCSGVQEV